MIETILHILQRGISIHLEIDIRLNDELPDEPHFYTISCDYCEWRGEYQSRDSAQRAKRAHLQHCAAYAEDKHWITQMHSGESHKG